MLRSAYLRDRLSAEVRLKNESVQKTGSFKPRGAVNRILSMSPEERARGIVTVSAGNHAAAAAYACRTQGIPCTVVMPQTAPEVKIDATRGYGATVVLHDDMRSLFARCEEVREEQQATFLHPFDDPAVIAGTGTAGLEIHEDFPEVDTVVVCVGGGGLISGVARAIKRLKPGTRVVGVEPVGAPTMTEALSRGEPYKLPKIESIADGLSAPFAGQHNLDVVREDVDEVVLVTDAEILEAVLVLMSRVKVVAEPAGAAALAGLLSGKVGIDEGSNVCATVSGGNLDPHLLAAWLG